MVVAVAKAMEAGAKAIMCASHRQHERVGGGLRGALRARRCTSSCPDGKIARGKLAQSAVHGAEIIAVDGNFDAALRLAREITIEAPDRAGELREPVPHRGAEDGGVRDRRRARRRAGRAGAPGRQRRATSRRTGAASSSTTGWSARRRRPRMLGFQAAGAAPLVHGAPVEHPQTIASRDPHRQPGVVEDGDRGARRVGRQHRSGHRRRDPGGVRPAGARRGHLLRAGVGGVRRRAAEAGGVGRAASRGRRSSASSPGTA